MEKTEKKGLNVSARSFAAAILVILVLMIAAYVLTLVIPAGSYARVDDGAGNLVIDTEGGFSYSEEGGLPFWKWLLSPVLVLGAEGGGTILAVVAFLLVVGGVFNSLEKCGLMQYMLDRIVRRFGAVRYRLMAVVTFFFMAMGAMIGSFEECVPLVPIVVSLAVSLGWDALTGIGMSLLAVGCGFASGVCNPFTVGVAQELAGLSMFSGAWMRLLAFVLIYGLLLTFLLLRGKRLGTGKTGAVKSDFVPIPRMDRGLWCFAGILGTGVAAVLCSGFLPALQDYTMIIVAVMFLAAGIVSCLAAGMKGRILAKTAVFGVISILPAVVMILMASSIRYTLETAGTLDTILYGAVGLAETMPRWAVVLFLYLMVLVMNFFIPSGSAKAFMLIPIIVPMARIFGISAQLCVLAFAFGDGFSNVFYPTNPALLISLGLSDVRYGTWFRWSWKFQAANLLLTAGLLLFGLWVGYA